MANLIFSIFIALLFNVQLDQSNNSIQRYQDHPLNEMLLGKWRSDFDKKWVTIYYKRYCVDYYEKEIPDTFYFKLTSSCNLKDSAKKIFLDNAYLILFSRDTSYFACNLILNLDSNTLSYQNDKTGKMQVFTRIRNKK